MQHTAILFIRTLIFNLIFYPLTLLWAAGLVLLTFPLPAERGMMPGVALWLKIVRHTLLRYVAGIRVEVRGLENVPRDRAVILAAKHMSNLDPIVTFELFPNMTALAKKELFRVPFLGGVLRKLRIVRIDRQSGRAHEEMPRVVAEVVATRRPLVVYPEGTRSRIGERRRLKSGAFHLQLEGNLPVIPVATNSGLHWPKGLALLRPGTVVYEFGPPLAHSDDKAAFMAAMERAVIARSDELIRSDPLWPRIAQRHGLGAKPAGGMGEAARKGGK